MNSIEKVSVPTFVTIFLNLQNHSRKMKEFKSTANIQGTSLYQMALNLYLVMLSGVGFMKVKSAMLRPSVIRTVIHAQIFFMLKKQP